MASTATTYDRDCSTILHLDGAAFSQAFTDASVNVLLWPADNQSNLDTSQKKFGPTSVYMDGTLDGMHSAANALFNFPGDFTIDLWTRFENINIDRTIFSQRTDANNYVLAQRTTAATLIYKVVQAGSAMVNFSSAFTPVLGTWYHQAYVRTGSTYIVFIDGTSLGTFISTASPANYTDNFYIGVNNIVSGSLAEGYQGWMDEIRIVKGTAVWTSNFTAPVAAYTQLLSPLSTGAESFPIIFDDSN